MCDIKVFALFSLFACAFGNPISSFTSIIDELDDDNYDIIIDQRQNGTQNFRFRINGLNIAVPHDEELSSSSSTHNSDSDLAVFLGLPTTATHTSSSSNNHHDDHKNDFADFAAFFDFKKNLKSDGKNNKNLADTQSRTKDIPTDSQLMSDTKSSVRDYVKVAGRKYKLLVGEKYLIPLLQFLKKQSESSDDE
jgi:hypothetical protein